MTTRKIIIHTILIAAATCGIAACQKDKTPAAEPSKVTISISAPVAGAIYHKGDTVNITAAVGYISQMHGYELKIKNKSTGIVYFTADEDVHASAFNVNQQWVDTLSSAAALELEITAEIDHNGNEAEKQVEFNSQP